MDVYTDALGGRRPAYTAIEKQMVSNPGSVVEIMQMPPNIPVLCDMKHWTGYELDQWTQHALLGQREQLPANEIFCWHLVPARPGTEPQLNETCHQVVKPGAKINWMPTELLYRHMMQTQEVQPNSKSLLEPWNGLPLARGSHIYAAYSIDLYYTLSIIHENHPEMLSLIEEVTDMEHDSLIHVSCYLPFPSNDLSDRLEGPIQHVKTRTWVQPTHPKGR